MNDEMSAEIVEFLEKLDADHMLASSLRELEVVRVVDKTREIGVFVINGEHEAPLYGSCFNQDTCPKGDQELVCGVQGSTHELS